MANTYKYVTLDNLSTFLASLKTKLASNSSTAYTVNYATNALKATQDASGNVITETYETKYKASIGKINFTASGETSATALTPSGDDRAVTIDLSGYALKSEITQLFLFKGVVANAKALEAVANPEVGWVYHVTEASSEYVYMKEGATYRWEALGSTLDLSNYYNKTETEGKITEALGKLNLTAPTGYYITSVSQTNGQISATAEAKGTVAEGNTALVDGGSVYTAIKAVDDKISALDVADGTGDYVSAVTQTDGKISVTKKAKGTVDSTSENLVDGKTVNTAITTAIGKLDVAEISGDYITAVSEADGKISATTGSKGSIEDKNTGLVDGGTVYTELQKYVLATEMVAVTEAEVQGLFA